MKVSGCKTKFCYRCGHRLAIALNEGKDLIETMAERKHDLTKLRRINLRKRDKERQRHTQRERGGGMEGRRRKQENRI